ncbi:hypothetical protein ACIQAL_19170 [Pseudomonas sp. NPDC088368]|uniref:hypothetical protein n=1 Tax=Pseudomonas sp. NPDC088368 TaxID=3364453 RepID=UPI0038298EF9
MAISIIDSKGNTTIVATRSREQILEEHRQKAGSARTTGAVPDLNSSTSSKGAGFQKRWAKRARLLAQLKQDGWVKWVAGGQKREFDQLIQLANEIPYDGNITDYDAWARRYGDVLGSGLQQAGVPNADPPQKASVMQSVKQDRGLFPDGFIQRTVVTAAGLETSNDEAASVSESKYYPIETLKRSHGLHATTHTDSDGIASVGFELGSDGIAHH